MARRTDSEMELAVINDYLLKDSEGYVFSPNEIANKYKIAKSSLYRILDRHSVPHRIVGTNHGVELAVIEDYLLEDSVGKRVFSLEEIAYKHKISVSTIRIILNRHRVLPRTNHKRDLAVINDYILQDSEGKYVFYPVEIADKYKITDLTLYHILARNGVPSRISMKKPRPNLLSYSDVMSNPKLLGEMIDDYRSKKPDGHYVYSYDKFLERNEISSDTWAEICKLRGIERRYKVSSGACSNKKPKSKKNSIEDLEPQIHEVVEAYNLVDGNGKRVYKLRKLYVKFGCINRTFYNLLRMARDKHNLRVNFRDGLKN